MLDNYDNDPRFPSGRVVDHRKVTCPDHGGSWGSDRACSTCTNPDGSARLGNEGRVAGSDGVCLVHGGKWGTEVTCPNCTNGDGTAYSDFKSGIDDRVCVPCGEIFDIDEDGETYHVGSGMYGRDTRADADHEPYGEDEDGNRVPHRDTVELIDRARRLADGDVRALTDISDGEREMLRNSVHEGKYASEIASLFPGEFHGVQETMEQAPHFPATETLNILPHLNRAPDSGTPREDLVSIKYAGGVPVSLKAFDWPSKKWGRSMSTAVGAGKTILDMVESRHPETRRVTASVAKAYGTATGTCLLCSRPLSSPASLSAGYGPECRGKLLAS
jgi:hypothetical protein